MQAELRAFLLLTALVLASAAVGLTQRHALVPTTATKVDPATPEGHRLALLQRKLARRARGYAKPDRPDGFAGFHQAVRTALDAPAPAYRPGYRLAALRETARLAKQGRLLPWAEHGPANVGGRTRGLAVDARDPSGDTWFAGSASGGIWKTTDAGRSWRNVTPELPNLATTTVVQAPSRPTTFYAGTGEGFYNGDAVRGDGLFKSTDGGETWTPLPATATADFHYVHRLLVDPADADVVVAATRTGLFRTTDGGAAWTRVLARPGSGSMRGDLQHVVADPSNFAVQYAAANGVGLYKSTDGGLTWARLNATFPGRRLELAVAPSEPTRLYAVAENGSASDLYVSADAGTSWRFVAEVSGFAPSWLGGQGWYNNAVAVHPTNPDVVFVGGINLWRVDLQALGQPVPVLQGLDPGTARDFFDYVDFEGATDGVALGSTILGTSDVAGGDYVNVELRFGPGRRQQAHRFVFGAGFAYPYQDFVEVPFEVWDVDNNRQLALSFRDANGDGAFTLLPYNASSPPREYLFIHALPYGTAPHPEVARTGGNRTRVMYFTWPVLADGALWNPAALPLSAASVRVALTTAGRRTTELTNWYPGRSRPGGGLFPFVHADHHNLTVVPLPGGGFRLLDGSDGGVAYSDDGGQTWTPSSPYALARGYNTTQFYGVDKKPGAVAFIGGTQDNGTWRSPEGATASSAWFSQLGGDGFDAVWHSEDGSRLLASYYFNALERSTNGGQTWVEATAGLADAGVEGVSPFITKIAKSTDDPDLLFVGSTNGVWRTDSFGARWRQSRFTDDGFWHAAGSYVFFATAISEADPQVVWAGAAMSTRMRPYVSTDGGLTFAPAAGTYGGLQARFTSLATHPLEAQTAYATFAVAGAPKILRTRDLGQTWESLTGTFAPGQPVSSNGFPDVAVYAVLALPHAPATLWAGTEIGLFVSEDDGRTWQRDASGLPAVSVWQLRVAEDRVVVATHGRGIWSVPLPELAAAPNPPVVRAPRLNAAAQRPSGELALDLDLRAPYDSVRVEAGTEVLGRYGANAAPQRAVLTFAVALAAPRTLDVQAVAYRSGRGYRTPAARLTLIPPRPAQTSYVTSFDDGGAGFTGHLLVGQPAGFSSPAAHSPHPYANAATYTYQLNTPIRVAATGAVLRYRDVALVEPGEAGSRYGDADFWDYVVVEGTKDGLHWLPLRDGYDARANASWLQAYLGGRPGSEALYVQREIDLHDTFQPGDVILLRFRFFTDANTTGWGWALDDVAVQPGAPVGADDPPALPGGFVLEANYPNPFNPTTTIPFAVPHASRVAVRVYDVQGRLVATLADGLYAAGPHRVTWQAAALASGVYYYTLEAPGVRLARPLLLLK